MKRISAAKKSFLWNLCLFGILIISPFEAYAIDNIEPPTAASLLSTSSAQSTSNVDPLAQIKLLRAQGQLDAAKNLAIHYLQNHPDDTDVLLMVGLIYYQQKNFVEAEQYLHKVLAIAPYYVDAHVALVKAQLAQEQLQQPAAKAVTTVTIPTQKTQQLQSVTQNRVAAVPTLAQIQLLRKQGKINEAKSLALVHLKQYPNDVDVMLNLGFIAYQQKDFLQAEAYFNTVLLKVPTYLDARIGLIRTKYAKAQYADALELIAKGLKLTPGNKDLIALKNNILKSQVAAAIKPTKKVAAKTSSLPLTPRDCYLKQAKDFIAAKNYEPAEKILRMLLVCDPDDSEARIALADIFLASYQDMQAYYIIKCGLVRQPDNTQLLIKKGEIQTTLRHYDLAADAYKRVLCDEPCNKQARGGLKEICSISPPYAHGFSEIGISSDNAYVSDLQTMWDYSSLYYSHNTEVGRVTAKVNYATRLGVRAPQYEMDFSPRLNRNVYFDLMIAYANQPVLFPRYALGAEGYFNVPNFLELSFGDKYSNIGPTYFSAYTASASKYLDKYWISFRPYYFTPKVGANSALFTGVVRRYFKTNDHYLSVTFGAGHSPDLADLENVNFIVINNRFVSVTYEFPIFNHHIVVDLGGGMTRWGYPTGLIRKLYDGSVGIKYRF